MSKGVAGMAQSAAADPASGFFRNPNRFNVAITRAQALMVVLGHPLVLMQVQRLCVWILALGLYLFLASSHMCH